MGLTRSETQSNFGSSEKLLDLAVDKARTTLLKDQHQDGYWCYPLEADCTIPAEYILMMHHMDEVDGALESKLAQYIRNRQNNEGGWPLFYHGKSDISCTVKAYYALKLAGDKPAQPHMQKARQLILSLGGAARCNVFTRIMLAMFRQIPWRGIPFIPVEIMLLPSWFPFHLLKVSYWSRTVMVPLFILCSLKASAKNPKNVDVLELFVTPPDQEKNYFEVRSTLNRMVLKLERVGFALEPFIPKAIRARALKKAENWMLERLNGDSGLGAIFPAMVNAYEALALLGYPPENPHRKLAREALEKLLIDHGDEAYCQPCVSPVWDTLLSVCALQDAGEAEVATIRGLNWLQGTQLLSEPGDWQANRPHLEGGGWPFQFKNDYYPDLDDTAFVGFTMFRSAHSQYQYNIDRAARWTAGLQSANGGFGAFDADNTHYYLNEIPFADHGALLDPPTSDVSGRCLMFLGLLKDDPVYKEACKRCYEFICSEQEPDGSWFGRWGTNYIYGTWSVLIALESYGIDRNHRAIQRAVRWLKGVQRPDGGWGEDNLSYHDRCMAGKADRSTSFQTAWAILALLSAGEAASESVSNGIQFLLEHQNPDGLWSDPEFTAPGFPKVFYLKYHGYSKYFPLWALARYRNECKLLTKNSHQ